MQAASEHCFRRCRPRKASAGAVCGVAKVGEGPAEGSEPPQICVQIATGWAQVDADLVKDAANLIKSALDSTQDDAECCTGPRLHARRWGFDAVAGGLSLDFGGLRSIRGVTGRAGWRIRQGLGGLHAGRGTVRAGHRGSRTGDGDVRGGNGGLNADRDRARRCRSGTGCAGV